MPFKDIDRAFLRFYNTNIYQGLTVGDEEQHTMNMRRVTTLASKLPHRHHIINKDLEKTWKLILLKGEKMNY